MKIFFKTLKLILGTLLPASPGSDHFVTRCHHPVCPHPFHLRRHMPCTPLANLLWLLEAEMAPIASPLGSLVPRWWSWFRELWSLWEEVGNLGTRPWEHIIPGLLALPSAPSSAMRLAGLHYFRHDVLLKCTRPNNHRPNSLPLLFICFHQIFCHSSVENHWTQFLKSKWERCYQKNLGRRFLVLLLHSRAMNRPHREDVCPDNSLNNRQKVRKWRNNKSDLTVRAKGGHKFPILENKHVLNLKGIA